MHVYMPVLAVHFCTFQRMYARWSRETVSRQQSTADGSVWGQRIHGKVVQSYIAGVALLPLTIILRVL